MVEAAKRSFASLLREHRVVAGLTQEELADRSNLSARTISDLERGIAQRPYPYTIQRLIEALGLTEEEAFRFQRAARRPGDADEPATLGRTARHGFSLPIQPTSFIGRQEEIKEVRSLLSQDDVRLLTLIGPGGVGKSRLALKAAEEVGDQFHDGVVFVSLAALADPELLPGVIATVLGMKAVGGEPILERLIEHLRGKRLLLILDNFEHLLPAADAVSRLLASCSALTILVTSRAVLHLAAEHEYPVAPLAIPTPQHMPELHVLSRYDAIQLFLQRARAVKPDFQLTDENALTIAEICFRLDGLPLAIELAAARIRLFPPHALLVRLSSPLGLLIGGVRDLPARQQTLRATIDWSYSLLSDEDQTLFRRLSVFVGGCTVEAAEAVCGEADGRQGELLVGLESLVYQSLLVVDERDGDARFRMLETVREYALERLTACGEIEEARRRHVEAYLHLAERAEQTFATANGPVWLGHLERDQDNLRAALSWSLEQKGTEVLAVRLAGALARFWVERGNQSEARRWIEHVAPLCEVPRFIEAHPRACAQILTAAGNLAHWRGDYAAARLYGERSVALWRLCDDALGLSIALRSLGRAVMQHGDHELARSLLRERVELTRELGASPERIRALRQLGQIEMGEGNFAAARSLFAEALELAQVSGSTRIRISLRADLANLACSEGDMAAARQLHEEALAQARATFDPISDAMNSHWGLTGAARLARRLGDYEQAIDLCEENLSLARSEPDSAENRWLVAWALNHLGDGLRCQGEHRRATALYEESLALFRQQEDRQGIAAVLHNLGHLALAQGETERARALFAQSLSLFHKLEFASSIADCLVGLAGVSAHEGDAEQAAMLFGAAEAAHQALDASGWIVEPANALSREREIRAAREKIDEEAWENAWSAGRAMSLDQALMRVDLRWPAR